MLASIDWFKKKNTVKKFLCLFCKVIPQGRFDEGQSNPAIPRPIFERKEKMNPATSVKATQIALRRYILKS